MRYKEGSFEDCVRQIVVDVLTTGLQSANNLAPNSEISFSTPQKRKYTKRTTGQGKVLNSKDKRLKKNRDATL